MFFIAHEFWTTHSDTGALVDRLGILVRIPRPSVLSADSFAFLKPRVAWLGIPAKPAGRGFSCCELGCLDDGSNRPDRYPIDTGAKEAGREVAARYGY